jgi:branched-chain amino acid transport system ATP-binding protein
MLVLDNVHTSYGAIKAVRGVSMRVERGQLVGVIGVNGAGKSTTLWTIAGVLTPVQGAITLNGESIVGLAPEAIVRKGIALVPEDRRILGQLTVEDNMLLGAAIYRSERARVQEELTKMYARFPILSERRSQLAGTLSGGEQQQLAIARGMMSCPNLLLLDEPSLGLAPILVEEIFEMIMQLRELGVTIVLVEQNVGRTLDIVDYVYLMDSGKVQFEGTPAGLRARVDVSETYLGITH